jgi:hypothetical protein
MTCQPMGIPREGPPRRVFQNVKDVTFLYPPGGDGGGGYSDFRVISLDGEKPTERDLVQTKYTGHSWAHWEGDTLVIESIGFTPETWLARGGFFHSENMKVTERLTRKGDQLLYESTVEDPDVLLQPWTLNPLLLTIADDDGPGAARSRLLGVERGTCQAYELDDISWQIHH